jgi:hypothetical protein
MSTVATISIEGPVVVLPLEDYEGLLARIEDLEDALALQEASTGKRLPGHHRSVELLGPQTGALERSG